MTDNTQADPCREALAKLRRELEVTSYHVGKDRLFELVDAAERALAQEPATSTEQEPAGWKLVPVEPTQEMMDAVVSTMDEFVHGNDAEEKYREDWAAMLAAAPQPPAASPPEFAEWRQTLVWALKASKSWTTGYAEAYVDDMLDRLAKKHFGDSAGADGKRPAAATEVTSESASDALNALRYRWASTHGVLSVRGWPIAPCRKIDWDRYIDAALARESAASGGGGQ